MVLVRIKLREGDSKLLYKPHSPRLYINHKLIMRLLLHSLYQIIQFRLQATSTTSSSKGSIMLSKGNFLQSHWVSRQWRIVNLATWDSSKYLELIVGRHCTHHLQIQVRGLLLLIECLEALFSKIIRKKTNLVSRILLSSSNNSSSQHLQ